MSNSISMLCTELKEALGDNKLSLPNSKVSAVQVDSFLKNILKTDSIAFTNASVTCKGNCITLKGDFRLFGIQLSANWGFSEGADGTITWQFGASTNDASTINSIVTHFLAKTYHLPSSFSGLPVNNIGFQAKINTSDKDYSLDLKAKTSWGDVELYVQKNSGVWGAALGVGVSKGFTLTKIDSNLSLFDDLEFSDSAIVVSDFTNKKLKISGITGVVDGAEFKSTLAVEANSSSSALPKIVNELAKSLSDIPVEISIDLTVTKDYEITAEIDKSFSFPGISSLMLNSIAMTIKSSPITAILSGDVSLPITIPAKPTVHSINVNGGISFTYSDGTVRAGATINSDTVINEPFDFYGVTLEDVGIGIDVSFGAETGAGVTLEGAFLLGESKTKLDEKFAISIEFTDDTPNPSLLYCETKNLSLPVIFNAVIDTGIKLPSVLSDFSYNDLMFYWCDEAQTLPDGTSCQVGIGYNAGINFWGFDTYSSLMINQGSGISGEASVNPIHLFNNKISLTGKGKAGHGIKANGPFFKFNTTEESFDVSVDADILGITEVINAKVSPTALDINMKSNLKFLEDSLSVEFKNGGTTMAFDSSLSISIACKPSIKIGGINLGTIPINDSMNGTIDVSFINGSLSAKVDAHFDFNGAKFGFNYDLGASVTDLKDLASVIENKIVSEAESIFSSYFSKVENYINVVGKGLITGGEFVVNVLYHVYTHSIIDTFKVLANLPTKFHVNGTLDFPIKIAPSIPSESVHVDLGKIVDHHADLHTDHWGLNFHEFNEHADLGASKTISTPSFDVTILDIDPKQHFDMVMPPSVHVNATSPRIGLDPHLDASLVGGSLGITGTVGVNATVDLTDINLDADARFNITGHAGVHADVAHIGVHGDKKHSYRCSNINSMGVELRPMGVKCNIACQYCYQHPQRDVEDPKKEYDIDLMKEAILKEGTDFSLFGGEALMVPIEDIEILWKWGLERFGKNALQTNGSLITNAHIDLFKKYNVGVGISIDGPEDLNDVRWAGNLERTRKLTQHSENAIAKLCEEGLKPSIIITLHRGNVGTLEKRERMGAWIKKLDKMGVGGARLHLMEVESESIRAIYHLTEKENIETLLYFNALESELKHLKFDIFGEIENLLKAKDLGLSCVWKACDPYTTSAVRGVEGKGQRSNCGRTNKEGIDFVKAGLPSYSRYIALYHTPQEHGGCKDCRFFSMCKGHCPGTSISGDWRNRTEHCNVWKTLFELTEKRMEDNGQVPLSKHPILPYIETKLIESWSNGINPSIQRMIEQVAQKNKTPHSMELLNYTIPPFKTVAWVSDNAKTIWDNRFKIINDALIQSTFKALKEGKLTSQYLIVEGWQYFKILELAATLNISVDALFLGDKNVKGPVYYQLLLTTKEVNLKDATPNCCINCSNAVRADKRKEFYWNAAIQSNLHTIDHQEITLPATTYTSIFWQKLLVTLGNQHCCNLECENYKNQQDKSLELLTHYNYNNAQLWLKDIYSWPVAWSASHGICELRTPIVKMAYDTDATATNYVIKIEGDSYPKEGAPGNQFPYRKRNFLRISDSKSFKAGLEHGS